MANITIEPILLKPEVIIYYADNIIDYVKEVIGVTPDDIQGDILLSVQNNMKTAVRSGHGIGKSALEAWAIKWYMYSRPFPKIPCTAPTQHQLKDILWAEVSKWNRQAADQHLFQWTAESFKHKAHPEEWFAVARTASTPDALQGFHADHILYVIDEASGVKDEIYQPVLGALTSHNSKLLMCGNPTRISGFFFDAFNKNRAIFNTFKVDGRDSSRVSKVFIQTIIDMFGEDSDVFRIRVAGDFPKSEPDSFIPLDWVEKAISKKTITLEAFSPKVHRLDIGVDVARFGDDESVIAAVINKRKQMPSEIYNHNDTMQLTGRLTQKVERCINLAQRIHVKIDCDGLGVGVYDRFCEVIRQKRWRNVYAYEGHFGGRGGKLKEGDPVEFENSTGLMWGTIREQLRIRKESMTNEIELWNDQEQIAQLANRKYRVNSDGKIVLERKEEMKKRGVKSPDRADALVLAMWDPPSNRIVSRPFV
jgi:hypothetical protein